MSLTPLVYCHIRSMEPQELHEIEWTENLIRLPRPPTFLAGSVYFSSIPLNPPSEGCSSTNHDNLIYFRLCSIVCTSPLISNSRATLKYNSTLFTCQDLWEEEIYFILMKYFILIYDLAKTLVFLKWSFFKFEILFPEWLVMFY